MENTSQPAKKRSPLVFILLAVVAIGAFIGIRNFLHNRHHESTDNAQIAFNYRFTEIPIEKTLNLEANCIIKLKLALTKMLFEDPNCVFIICLSFENYLKDYKQFEAIISNYDKGRDRTITIINKVYKIIILV